MGVKGLAAGLLLFYGSLFGVQAQERSEKHKVEVVDENSNPLYGAHILVNDTLGTITNSEGVAFIKGLSDAQHNLRISYMGYSTINAQTDSGKHDYSFMMNPSIIEGQTITVLGTRKNERPSSPEQNVPERILESTNSAIGKSQTEQVFISTPGFSVLPGNFNFATADETDFTVKVNGIPVNMNAFLDYDAPWYGEFMNYELYTAGMSPENPRGQFGLLDFRTNYSHGDRLRISGHADVVRAQLSTIFPVHKSVINASFEHNLLKNWGFVKEFNPSKSQFLGGVHTGFEKGSLNINALLSQSSIDLANRPFSPSQEIWQAASSVFYKKVYSKNILEVSAVFNRQSENIMYGKEGNILNSRTAGEIKLKNTTQHSSGILKFGAEVHGNYDKLSFNLEGINQIPGLQEAAVSGDEYYISQLYFPVYVFGVNSTRLSEKTEIEYGAVSLFDPKHISKGITFGPYFGISYSDKDFFAKLSLTERYTDQDYNILSDGIIPLNYASLKYPKSDQVALTLRHGDFGHRLLYAKFRDQYKKEATLNPEMDWLMNQYAFHNLSNMTPEELIILFPALAQDPDALQNMVQLIQDLPNEEEEINEYYKKYGDEYVNNRNRDVLSYTAWYTNNDNFLISGTLTKAEEGGLFSGNTPYKEGIAFSLKAFYTDILFGKKENNNISFSTSLQINSGRRYTDKYPRMSIAEENDVTSNEIQMLSEYFGEDMTKYLTKQRALQGPRNNEVLPTRYDFTIGTSYNFRNFLGLEGSVGLFAANPQLFFKGVEKNKETVYFTYDKERLVKKYGSGAGALGGAFISLRF